MLCYGFTAYGTYHDTSEWVLESVSEFSWCRVFLYKFLCFLKSLVVDYSRVDTIRNEPSVLWLVESPGNLLSSATARRGRYVRCL